MSNIVEHETFSTISVQLQCIVHPKRTLLFHTSTNTMCDKHREVVYSILYSFGELQLHFSLFCHLYAIVCNWHSASFSDANF